MSATESSRVAPSDPAQLTVLYTTNEDGCVTAQIAEYPGAISQGQAEHEAWTNVLDAVHDLAHQPTTTERLVSLMQARIVERSAEAAWPVNQLLQSLAAAAPVSRISRHTPPPLGFAL